SRLNARTGERRLDRRHRGGGDETKPALSIFAMGQGHVEQPHAEKKEAPHQERGRSDEVPLEELLLEATVITAQDVGTDSSTHQFMIVRNPGKKWPSNLPVGVEFDEVREHRSDVRTGLGGEPLGAQLVGLPEIVGIEKRDPWLRGGA